MIKRYLLAASLLISATALFTTSVLANPSDDSGLTPFKAEYVAYVFGDDVGYATLELKHIAYDQYSLTYGSKVSKFFLSDKRNEHSIFRFNDGQITAKDYYYNRSGFGSDKQLEVNFDEESAAIMVDGNRLKDWQGEFDNQLFRIDIPLQLAAGNNQMEYDFINYRGEQRRYVIKQVGEEQLQLPYGTVDSIKMTVDRGSSSRITYAWFSPSLDYTLVRLQQFKDGEEQGDIKLKSLQR